MKRKNPDTSHKAFEMVSIEMLSEHYKRIIKSLTVLGTANYEKISMHNGMDKHQVGRRLKELEEMGKTNDEPGLIYKPGTTSLTKGKRPANDYCLTGKWFPKTDNEIRDKPVSKKERQPLDQLTLFKL